MRSNSHKNILLGITGGIAAYKSVELVRLLREQHFSVRVVMTQHATQFVTPLTFQAISGNPVHSALFDATEQTAMRHIELAKWADKIIIAPASANSIAKIANGIADDLLTTICLASNAPLIIAPAMNKIMWENKATEANIKKLHERGAILIGPDAGTQACGDNGFGRMSEPLDIIAQCVFTPDPFWKNKKIVITAGPTAEIIDPIRFLSNKSSGKMGYAIAEAAAQWGAEVILISGPTQLSPPANVKIVSVNTALEMHDAVFANIENTAIFIGCAAVANYRIENPSAQKIKSHTERLTLPLTANPDIIADVAHLKQKPFTVGFGAETENVIDYATQKLKKKNLDLMVANDVSDNQVMGSDYNAITLINKNGEKIALQRMPKKSVALEILHHIQLSVTSVTLNANLP